MKKLNKLFAILVAMAMMLSLTVISAFAAPNIEGTETQEAKAAITKKLAVPEGATVPAAKFKFTFAGDNTASTSNAPAIADKYASFSTSDTVTGGYAIKNATDILNGVNWGTAGRYVYTVKEAQQAYKPAQVEGADVAYESATGTTEEFSYSKAEYKMTVDVKAKADGSGLYVANIAVEQIKNDEGEQGTGKVSPGNPASGDSTENGFAFTNKYSKVADTTPTGGTDDPQTPEDESKNASFVISKTVAGKFGDTTKPFTFTLTTDQSATNTAAKTLTYALIAKDGTVTDLTALPAPLTLKDGEKLAVYGAPIGTTYSVSETLANDDVDVNYKSEAVVKEGGSDADASKITNPANPGTGAAVAGALVKEGTNSAAFTNTNTKNNDDTTPEGILISNLPYIALALIAIGGLVAYVVVRRRNADEA